MTERSRRPGDLSGAPEPRPDAPAPVGRGDLPAQPSLRRLRAFGVRPNRDLGQNFLIDSNLLAVIGRAAELADEDVVLEVGGGLGVLSEYLAARTAHLHVVELDRRLEPPLRDALAGHPNATLHFADAVKLDLAALQPAPTKVVANLPYGVAATVILRTIEELPGVRRWVAMVQKGFAHRRKALARSLSLAPGAPRDRREQVRAALEAMGRPADARAESLEPDAWRELWARLEAEAAS